MLERGGGGGGVGGVLDGVGVVVRDEGVGKVGGVGGRGREPLYVKKTGP